MDPSWPEFVVKRACRAGFVTRADAARVLHVSNPTATRVLAFAEVKYRALLERHRRGLRAKAGVPPPRFASEEALLEQLDIGGNQELMTGLFERELPVVRVQWVRSLPERSGTLTTLTTAIVHRQMARIVYLAMRKDDVARWRRIAPIGLERMNDQWRLLAQDLERSDFPVKTFVLSRIMDAEVDRGRKPNGFVLAGHDDKRIKFPVTLNAAYSEAQKNLVRLELGIVDGKIALAERSHFEFLRRFSRVLGSDRAVWPPLMIAE